MSASREVSSTASMRWPHKRLVIAITQKLQRAAIGAANGPGLIKREHALARRADEFGEAVKAQHAKFLAGLEQRAVLDVLRGDIDERESVGLRSRGGAGDVERRE